MERCTSCSSNFISRVIRLALLAGGIACALQVPVPLSAQVRSVSDIPFSGGPDGPYGTADLKVRANCAGGFMLQIAVTRVRVDGVAIGGTRYSGSQVPGFTFPTETQGGLLYLSGAVHDASGGARFRLKPGRSIGVELGGFLDYIYMVDRDVEASGWNCQRWRDYVAAASQSRLVLSIDRTENLGRGLYYDAKNALERAEREAAEEARREREAAEQARRAAELADRQVAEQQAEAEARSRQEQEAPQTSGEDEVSGVSVPSSDASSTTGPPALSPQERVRFDSALRLARQFESAGNYRLAIQNYRAAFAIRQEDWIASRVRYLESRQQAEARDKERRTEAGAQAMAQGVRAVGAMTSAYADGLDDNALRIFNLEANLGISGGEAAASDGYAEDFTTLGGRIDAEAELNLWLPLGSSGPYNIGGAVGWRGSVLMPISYEAETSRFRGIDRGHYYLVKAGWRGYLEIGHGVRAYNAEDEEGEFRVEALEGLMVFSAGNFLRKGGSWRVSYLTTTDLALLGGGDRRVEEQNILASYWPAGSAFSLKAGMTSIDYEAATDKRPFFSFFVSLGIAIR